MRGVGTVILSLLACKRDITFHVLSLEISVKRGRGSTEVSETELILNRACLLGAVSNDEMQTMTICPKPVSYTHLRAHETDS